MARPEYLSCLVSVGTVVRCVALNRQRRDVERKDHVSVPVFREDTCLSEPDGVPLNVNRWTHFSSILSGVGRSPENGKEGDCTRMSGHDGF